MSKQTRRLHGERRAQVRYPHHSEASCQLLGTAGEASWPAALRNLSRGGAMFVMDREMHLGAVLEVMLEGHGGRFSHPLLMRVRNARPGDGSTWLIGCSFVRPLTPHDMEVLMLDGLAHRGGRQATAGNRGADRARG